MTVPVIISGLETENENFEYTMSELSALCEANDMEVVQQISQKLEHPVAATYFGKGKAEEIFHEGELHEVETLIVNDELTPTQLRNLEDITEMRVVDRTALILEIFASRAHTKEAKLQVQIAKLQYQLPRLRTSSINKMDQQTAGNAGGGYTNRGSGETKMELNRRVIEKRINNLSKELKEIEANQETQSKLRDKSGIKTVALVGYTNAGKSTTMNGLLKMLGQDPDKEVFEKDMLFATLDTSVRKLKFNDNKEILLSDTVGFVSKLPHQLVKAFRTTLYEASKADLLIQVIDGADEHAKEMIETTTSTLKEIGVTDIPMIYAYNKADLAQIPYPIMEGDQLTYSARDQKSLELLINVIKDKLFDDYQTHTYLLPFSEGRYLEVLNQEANILSTDYLAEGTKLEVEVNPILAAKLKKFQID